MYVELVLFLLKRQLKEDKRPFGIIIEICFSFDWTEKPPPVILLSLIFFILQCES